MKIARFVVDAHVHAQRFAAGKTLQQSTDDEKVKKAAEAAKEKFKGLHDVMIKTLEPYDNSPRLLYDMECYGVDMCVLLPAFDMTNELNMKIVEEHPEKFVACCAATRTKHDAIQGRKDWTAEAAANELDELMATGKFVGLGEGMPQDPNLGAKHKKIDINQRLEEIHFFMEVARKHKCPIRYHTGICMGYTTCFCRGLGANPDTFNPMWVHDIAVEYPDVPIIMEHGGIQAGWWEKWYEECLNVAAATDNVYLETGMWWTELYEKPLMDPNIGAKKLIWATDWGASIPFHWQAGKYPETYPMQKRYSTPPRHQVDFFGWSLKQLWRLNIPQDDLNLIMGGNIARLYKLKLPHTRLFPFVE